ncbi:MAG: hypothetical protein N2491_13985, partial [Negativicutes bacterium]|nr:hypothetical protein [Negativicutes bacterium]
MRDLLGNTAVKIALIYFTVSGTWIAASDLLLGALVEDAKIIAYLGIVKGWFFVFITTIMLFTLVRGNIRLLEAKNKDLHARSMETEAAYEELAATEEELRWQLDELQR